MPRYIHDCDRCIFLGEWREYDLYFCPGSDPTVIARHGDESQDYLSGLSFGESGITFPLARALSMAKEKGLYLSVQEKTILPEHDKSIFIVIGEGQDTFWPIRGFRDKTSALLFAQACAKKAALWHHNSKHSGCNSPPYFWSALDPKMLETVGIVYKVHEFPISLRPEELSSTWETCPICRGQVYNTPDGRICENGHEAI